MQENPREERARKTTPQKKVKKAAPRKQSSDIEDLEDNEADLGGGTWEALAPFWPLEDRPPGIYRRRKWVEQQSMETMLKLQEVYERKQRDLNAGGGVQKDTKPAVINIKKSKDDHFEQLADCRFEFRRPLSPWDFWWPLVPVQWKDRYNALDLVSLGMEAQLARSAINRLHDRRLSNDLKIFCKRNAGVSRDPMKETRLREGDTNLLHD